MYPAVSMRPYRIPYGFQLVLAACFFSGCAATSPAVPTAVSTENTDKKNDLAGSVVPGGPHTADGHSLSGQETPVKDPHALQPSSPKPDGQPQDRKTTADAADVIVQKPPEPPTALQEAPGPRADDRLLDLWQKDLEEAMKQPPGRRKIQFSMPTVENDRVRYFVNFFCHRKKDFFERSLARSGRYIPMMATILQEEGLPEDLVYLSLIESGFALHAISKAKAVGPWQFIRATGLRYGLKINGWLDERRDPEKSTRAAAAYLKDLHEQFGQWFLAAAAYNAGEGKVEKAINRSKADNFWELSGKKSYLKEETRNYVPKFIAATVIASTPDKFGFGEVVYESPVEYDEVFIKTGLKLETVAELAGTTVNVIRELNPALLRNVTPPLEEHFVLRIPVGKAESFTRSYERLPESAVISVTTHKVKKGETLRGIAARYGQTTTELMELNGLKTRKVRAGKELTVLMNGVPQKR